MTEMTLAILLGAMAASMAGMVALCVAIERRNRKEARRETFGLFPGEESWP